MRISGIYAILNLVDDKIYVGSSSNMTRRWIEHRCYLKNQTHKNSILLRAYNKYGIDCFIYVILEITARDKHILAEREQHWLNVLQSFDRDFGYNIKPVAYSQLGFKHSESSKAKMSVWQIGRKMSAEAKIKIGAAHKGKKLTDAQKLKFSWLGRKHSEETKAKMKKSRAGRVFTDQARHNMSEGAKRRRFREKASVAAS